jgi:hypothetical protein
MSAILTYRAMAAVVHWHDLKDENGTKVADCLILLSPSGVAWLELVPVPEFFAPSRDYQASFAEVMKPVLAGTFGGEQAIRRIESEVPASRGRTKKALVSLGFKFEGKRVSGVQFYGKEPEDACILGLLFDYLKGD